jgi:predicted metal-dependent hydrolase
MEEGDLQEVAAKACEHLGIPTVRIVVKGGALRGRAKIKKNIATVPAWALKLHPGYAVYYTLHELSHFKVWRHGPAFQEVEQELCGQFEILLKYRRVFPDAINWKGEHISCTKKDIRRACQ